jgi:hypothetical protein
VSKIHEVTDEQLSELKAKHGERKVLRLSTTTPDGVIEVAVMKPGRKEYERFRKQLGDDAKRDGALENLLRAHVLAPERAKFDELLEEYPALPEEFGKPLLSAIGLSGSAEVGKS